MGLNESGELFFWVPLLPGVTSGFESLLFWICGLLEALDGATPGALPFQKGPVLWRRRLCFYLLFTGATSGALPFQKGPVLRRRMCFYSLRDQEVLVAPGAIPFQKGPVSWRCCRLGTCTACGACLGVSIAVAWERVPPAERVLGSATSF